MKLSEESKTPIIWAAMVAVILIAFTFAFGFPRTSGLITGYASVNTLAKNLDIMIDKSTSFELVSATGEPVYINEFRLSGAIVGSGVVKVFIRGEDKDYLVFTNVGLRDTKPSPITGMAIASSAVEVPVAEESENLQLKESGNLPFLELSNEFVVNGVFENECIDSCYLPLSEFNKTSFTFSVYLEPGTTISLSRMYYTV